MQVKDMFPSKFLRGQDMSKPMLIEMRGVQETGLRAGPDKPEEKAVVLFFDDVSTGKPAPVRGLLRHPNGHHALVLRRTLAEEIMAASATDDTDQWAGKRVVLYHEQRTVARRNVVSIRARAARPNTQPADAAGEGGK